MVEREASKLIDQGLPPDQARAKPQALLIDSRGCRRMLRRARHGFVDNTIRDVRFALRPLRRTPLIAFTIGATVAIGLGIVAAYISLGVVHHPECVALPRRRVPGSAATAPRVHPGNEPRRPRRLAYLMPGFARCGICGGAFCV